MEFTILCHCPLPHLTFFATTYFHLIKLLLVGLPWHANAHETGGLFWKSAVLVFFAATFIQIAVDRAHECQRNLQANIVKPNSSRP